MKTLICRCLTTVRRIASKKRKNEICDRTICLLEDFMIMSGFDQLQCCYNLSRIIAGLLLFMLYHSFQFLASYTPLTTFSTHPFLFLIDFLRTIVESWSSKGMILVSLLIVSNSCSCTFLLIIMEIHPCYV